MEKTENKDQAAVEVLAANIHGEEATLESDAISSEETLSEVEAKTCESNGFSEVDKLTESVESTDDEISGLESDSSTSEDQKEVSEIAVEKTDLSISLSPRALVEGFIFASQHPVSLKSLRDVLEITEDDLKVLLAELETEYFLAHHGFGLAKVAGGYQFRTKPELKEIMARFYEKKPPRLTQATLEVLSIISYKQPITRSEIEKIRGVDCTGVLKTLLERELIEMRGRSDLPGHPVVYGTTAKFLEWFQINSISDLPPLSEMEILNRGREEGFDQLLDSLNRDDGFQAASINEMDDELKNLQPAKIVEFDEPKVDGSSSETVSAPTSA